MENVARDTLKGQKLHAGMSGAYGIGYVNFGASVTADDTLTVGSDVYQFKTSGNAAAGMIKVDVSGGVTAAIASDAFIVAVNANARSAVVAVDISTSLVLLKTKRAGGIVTLAEGMTSASNTVDQMGASVAEDGLAQIAVFRIVPTAAQVTKGSIAIGLDFVPRAVTVQVRVTATGVTVAWNGAVTLDVTNKLVTIDNTSTTDWAATDTVAVLVY